MATYKKLLKNRAGDTILPVVGVDLDYVSNVLCVAINTTTLSGNYNNKSRWSAGTWTQYGLLAKTSGDKSTIAISAPQNEEWTVLLEHVTGPAHPTAGSWSYSGITELNSSSIQIKFLTSSVVGTNSNDYSTQTSATVVTIQPGTTRYFAVYVATGSNSGSYTWTGGGESTSTSAWELGNSCVFKATLIKRRYVGS